MSNLLIQIPGFISTILYFASYQCKSNKRLFQIQFLSYVFYTVHFLLLGAWTGGISYCLNTFRSFCLGSSSKKANSKGMCAVICVLQIAVMVLTWNGWISILPVAANIATTLGGYSHNGRKIRLAGIFINSPLWIIYDILVGSWAGILDELISETSMILSIIRYGWKGLDEMKE